MTKEDGPKFITHLVEKASMQLSPMVRKYLLKKIGHHIPIYIQLLIEECDEILYTKGQVELNNDDIDLAYKVLLKKHQHFIDWDERLKNYYKEKYTFLLSILNHAAHKDGISIQEVYNIAVKHQYENSFKADLDDILVADGYLFENDQMYFFNSPLLKDWWKSRHPIFENL